MKRNKSLGDEQHKCGMIEMVCRALQDSQREKDQLAAENARLKRLKAENPELEKLRAKNHALKKQITKQTSNMINERKKMIEKLKSSNLRLSKSKHQLTSLIQLLKFEKAKKKELEKVLKHMNMSLKVKEGEVITLNADLMLQEDKLRHSILENERKEEVQKKIREIDERWSSDYEEFLENEIKLEEDIELPIQQNMLPQEQALKTDSDKETVEKEKEEEKERKKSGQEEKMENGEKEEIEGTTRRRLPCFLFNFKPSNIT